MLRRAALCAFAALASVGVALPAAADGSGECAAYNSRGQCLFYAEKPEGGDGSHTKKKADVVSVGSCTWHGCRVPCSTADGWYDSTTGCYLKLSPDRPMIGPDPSKTDPAIVKYRCALIVAVIRGRPVVEAIFRPIFRKRGPTTPVIDPREAARAVVARMTMRAITIGIVPRPGRSGYVNLPVWMWVTDPGPATTGPLTVTDSDGGLSITATAKLDRIVWSMGDGTSVTCGAGTPYYRTDQVEDSPDCGHRYLAASTDQPGGRYTVRATSYWDVHWAGGGAQGDFDDVHFGRAIRVPIAELRPVLIAPGN